MANRAEILNELNVLLESQNDKFVRSILTYTKQKAKGDDKGVRVDKDNHKLPNGISQLPTGRYVYRFTDPNEPDEKKKRKYIYSWDLADLKEKSENIKFDIRDGIRPFYKKTLNEVLEENFIEREKENSETTMINYRWLYDKHIKNSIGKKEFAKIDALEIKAYYNELRKTLSFGTVKLINKIISPCFEEAVRTNVIRQNPCKYITGKKENKKAKSDTVINGKRIYWLTKEQQDNMMNFIKKNSQFSNYYSLFTFMLGTACRLSETIGMTWDDIDLKNKSVSVNHQLICKSFSDGTRAKKCPPKTDAGNREIPMTSAVYSALMEQKKFQLQFGIPRDCEVDGLKNFVFTKSDGKPLLDYYINRLLKNIVTAYNESETKKANEENRKEELLPSINPHMLRHTACTRMAESGMDMKIAQKVMGHSSLMVTMQVYNHIEENKEIIVSEMKKMEA